MRAACLAHGCPGSALVGPVDAWLVGRGVMLCLPAPVEAATACLDAVLPSMRHAIAQAGGTPPVLRQR